MEADKWRHVSGGRSLNFLLSTMPAISYKREKATRLCFLIFFSYKKWLVTLPNGCFFLALLQICNVSIYFYIFSLHSSISALQVQIHSWYLKNISGPEFKQTLKSMENVCETTRRETSEDQQQDKKWGDLFTFLLRRQLWYFD